MKPKSFSPNFTALVDHFEASGDISKFLTAYKDGAGVWTIGRGTTIYPDGSHVKQGDTCTLEQAEEYCTHHCKGLFSPNPDDFEGVEAQLLRWINVRKNGVLMPSDGLTRRRKSEAYLYRYGINHGTFYL
jgi:GH24 family phage-related lysozyme (muramidase)